MSPELRKLYDTIALTAIEESRLYRLVFRKGAHIASKGSMLAHHEALRDLRDAVDRYLAALHPVIPSRRPDAMIDRGGR